MRKTVGHRAYGSDEFVGRPPLKFAFIVFFLLQWSEYFAVKCKGLEIHSSNCGTSCYVSYCKLAMLHTLCCGWKWESLFHTLPGSLSLFFYVSWFCTLSAMFSPLLISVYFLIYVSNCGIKMLWCWLCLKAVESEQEIPHLIPDKHDEEIRYRAPDVPFVPTS